MRILSFRFLRAIDRLMIGRAKRIEPLRAAVNDGWNNCPRFRVVQVVDGFCIRIQPDAHTWLAVLPPRPPKKLQAPSVQGK